MNKSRIAILIDGGFFLKRLAHLVPEQKRDTPEKVVACIRNMCRNHIQRLTGTGDSKNTNGQKGDQKNWIQHVYRIFFYDAHPYDGKAHHPLDNRQIDFSKSEVARFRTTLFELLRKERKLALRLGKVSRDHDWVINPALTKKLLRTRQHLDVLQSIGQARQENANGDGSITLHLSPSDAENLVKLYDFWQTLDSKSVTLGLRQKGVDMRIGVDIASITLKRQADTIVLVAGDSDFVPASKLARREGLEFILDPMWQQVNDDLFEHIDGLQSGLPKPADKTSAASDS